jgi:glucuronokinase
MPSASVPARAALAGNPSDGYGGAVVAVCLDALRAEVETGPGTGIDGPAPRLLEAARAAAGSPAVALRARTTIPREVGLAGSSALVLAALQALEVPADGIPLAWLALEVERSVGLTAGLQDRITQTLGGTVAMDFAAGTFRRLEVSVPPLVVAWRDDGAQSSGVVHRSLRERFDAGDPDLVGGMRTLREHGLAAAAALSSGDRRALAAAMDGSLETRASFVALDPAVRDMAAICRAFGAPVNQAGSGGAVVALAPARRESLVEALAAAGCGVLEA